MVLLIFNYFFGFIHVSNGELIYQYLIKING